MEGKGKEGKEGRIRLGIELGSIWGKKKELYKKKRTCLACYQEGSNFIEPWVEKVFWFLGPNQRLKKELLEESIHF